MHAEEAKAQKEAAEAMAKKEFSMLSQSEKGKSLFEMDSSMKAVRGN